MATKRRGTIRQQKLAKAIIQNLSKDDSLNAGQLLESVGYPHSTATTYPGAVLEQSGVKIELALLGFTEEKAKSVVSHIMNSPDEESKDRLKAAEMVFKVFGSFKEDSTPTPVTINHNLFYKPEFRAAIEDAEAEMKKMIYHAKSNDVDAPAQE